MFSFISSAATLFSSARDLIGGGDEPNRIRANDSAYQSALNGDPNALLFLKQRTGDFGIKFVPGYGEIGGWATDSAQRDARTKYEAALLALDGQQAAGALGGRVQDIAQQTGHTIVPGTKTNVTMVLIVGGAIIAALAVYAARGR